MAQDKIQPVGGGFFRYPSIVVFLTPLHRPAFDLAPLTVYTLKALGEICLEKEDITALFPGALFERFFLSLLERKDITLGPYRTRPT